MTDLSFVDYILDNIHGYIPLTDMESRIEKLPVFRRLRGIKQLGLTNWIFPGAEHTRYSHSLGVMHIADSIAARLGFAPNERMLIRVAGMLHDIGHYPLSHVGERAYKNRACPIPEQTVGGYYKRLAEDDERDPRFITHTFMQKSVNPFHHESVGEAVIRASGAISAILAEYGMNIDDVCAIITGDITNERLVKFVQILHCEMDADRIDYLLRDTFSSGTAYGAFEINTLIKNMAISNRNEYGADIIGVNAKGIMSADQFLINRYFAYRQVFYHKYVTALSNMSQRIISWFLEAGNGPFPGGEALLGWVREQDNNELFFNFTDSFFMDAIKGLDPHKAHVPPDIAAMADMLNHYLTPGIKDGGNIILSGLNNGQLLAGMQQAGLLDADGEGGGCFLSIDESFLTEHVPIDRYIDAFRWRNGRESLPFGLEEYLKHRLINGVAYIRENGEARLLYDDNASLTKDLCRHRTVFFRIYDWAR